MEWTCSPRFEGCRGFDRPHCGLDCFFATGTFRLTRLPFNTAEQDKVVRVTVPLVQCCPSSSKQQDKQDQRQTTEGAGIAAVTLTTIATHSFPVGTGREWIQSVTDLASELSFWSIVDPDPVYDDRNGKADSLTCAYSPELLLSDAQ